MDWNMVAKHCSSQLLHGLYEVEVTTQFLS